MKAFIKNIASVFLAFLVLFSTLSFTISEHYCGNTLVNSSIFSQAKNCGMEMPKKSPIKDCSIEKKDCCKDVVKLIKGQEDLKIDYLALSFDQQLLITSFVYTYINLFEGLDTQVVPFKYYSPPLVVKNIQKLDETYLI